MTVMLQMRTMRKILTGMLAAVCLCGSAWADGTLSAGEETLIPSDFIFDTPMTPLTYATCGDVLRNVCRLNAARTGGTLSENADFASLLQYADGHGIDTARLGREPLVIRFGDACVLLYEALGNAACRPVREWEMPDTWETDDETKTAIAALVRAGIAEGDSFRPGEFLTRADWEKLLRSAAIPAFRSGGEPAAIRDYGESALLCSTVRLNNPYTNTADSGWRAYYEAATANLSDRDYSVISDVSDTKSSRLVRYFNAVNDGLVTLRLKLVIQYGFDGLTLTFGNRAGGDDAYVLETENGCFYQRLPDGKKALLLDADGKVGAYRLEITLDMDNGIAATVIDGTSRGKHEMTGGCFDFMALATKDDTKNVVSVYPTIYVTKNYAVYDTFEGFDVLPYGYKASGDVSVKQYAAVVGKNGKLSKNFEAIADKTAFTFNAYLPTSHTGAEMVLKCGDKNAVRLMDMFGVLYANGVKLGSYDGRLWQKIRFEADFSAQTADIYLNGKKKATVPFASQVYYADGISFGNTGNEIKIDDIRVFRVFPTSVPSPELPAGSDGYTIGINVCNLWREGEHMGWEEISPYAESLPVLGFYDEGSPESANWECKYMAEHGIDFGAVCWFGSETNAPMKTTEYGSQLEDGYFYAAYSDRVKFALLWEAANGRIPTSKTAFSEYFVPYWTENFFKDERYMTSDGRLFFAVFGADRLIDTFGTELKEMFDGMRTAVRSATGKDMLILACNAGNRKVSAYGFDGAYAYGIASSTVYSAQYCNQTWADDADVPWIPSFGAGYNSVGWLGDYTKRMTVSDFESVCRWVKDSFMASNGGTNGWRKNLLMLGTWNEYGEGSHLMPCDGLHGFDYLDTVRNVFTDGGAHTDTRPDAAQKSRITYNYPQYLKKLAPRGFFARAEDYDTTHISRSLTSTSVCNALLSADGGLTRVSVGNDGATYRTTSGDPIFYFKSAAYSALSCDDICAVEVVASGIPAGDYMQLFFRTEASDEWSEANSVRAVSPSTGETCFVFRVGQNANWTGAMGGIRLDPCTASGVTFVLKQINIIKYTSFPRLYVNGAEVKTSHLTGVYSPEDKTAHYPFEPAENKLDEYLFMSYEYDFSNGVLTLRRDGTTAVLTPGKASAMVNGAAYTLASPMYLCDGIPMLPITSVADIFGFGCEKRGDDYYLTTPEKSRYDDCADTGLSWTFDKIGVLHGFTTEGLTLSYTGSAIGITSVTGDPILYGPALTGVNCDDYGYIECKVRWDVESDTARFGVYFITEADSGYSEARYVGQNLASSSNGAWQVIRLPMSRNANWKGTLKRFRLDGFDGDGSMEIAYIRFAA